jgi:hypothetical protein
MNRSILESLSVDELKAHINEDSTFTKFYSEAQKMGEWISESELREAQYGEITYERLRKYLRHGKSSLFWEIKGEAWQEDYNRLYPDYHEQVDSIMNYWREHVARYNMDSVVTVEFSDLRKEYYYSGDVRDVYIGFKITPLKETVDQLIFRYEMKTKVGNDGEISAFNSHRCVATTPVSEPTTLYWEADYSDEKALKSRTSDDVRREYDFNIELVNIRINGENYEDKLKEVPEPVQMALKHCTPEDNWYEVDIIKQLINPSYKDFYEYTRPLVDAEMKRFDSEVFSLFEEYYRSQQDQ